MVRIILFKLNFFFSHRKHNYYFTLKFFLCFTVAILNIIVFNFLSRGLNKKKKNNVLNKIKVCRRYRGYYPLTAENKNDYQWRG